MARDIANNLLIAFKMIEYALKNIVTIRRFKNKNIEL